MNRSYSLNLVCLKFILNIEFLEKTKLEFSRLYCISYSPGGPGSGKGTQCEKIVQRYPGFVHLSMGDILRTQISDKGTADEKWSMISQLLSKGEMAPEVCV